MMPESVHEASIATMQAKMARVEKLCREVRDAGADTQRSPDYRDRVIEALADGEARVLRSRWPEFRHV